MANSEMAMVRWRSAKTVSLHLHGCAFAWMFILCVCVMCAFEAFLARCSFCENLREVAVRWHLRVDSRVTTNVT